MSNSAEYRHKGALEMLFRRKSIAQLSELRRALGVRSRTTVLSALKTAGYYSSYSHAGRYYTLAHIPRFDSTGLWSHCQVGFSKHGTLRATVVVIVQQTPEGCSHEELRVILGVRLHDTLRSLVEDGLLGRERVGAVFVYLSADSRKAAEQVACRRELVAVLAEALRALTDEEVVEVLVEALRAAPEVPDPACVARRLVARGVRLEPHHVEQVFEEHGLEGEKKTEPPSSRHSPR